MKALLLLPSVALSAVCTLTLDLRGGMFRLYSGDREVHQGAVVTFRAEMPSYGDGRGWETAISPSGVRVAQDWPDGRDTSDALGFYHADGPATFVIERKSGHFRIGAVEYEYVRYNPYPDRYRMVFPAPRFRVDLRGRKITGLTRRKDFFLNPLEYVE